MVKKIGIFGGSFDPPHSGHQHLVETCLKEFNFDQIYVVPCYQNPEKNIHQTKPQNRFKMLEDLFKNFNKVTVSDIEIKQKEINYTMDTLNKIDLTEDTYLIVGEDLLFQMHNWKSYEKIIERVHLLVVLQSQGEWISKKKEWPNLLKKFLKKWNKESLELTTSKKIYFLHSQKFQHLSSHLIRHKVHSGVSIQEDVPKNIIPLILEYYRHLQTHKDWIVELISFLKDKGALHPESFTFKEAVYESILVSSGLNTRHVQALSLGLQEHIKEKYGLTPRHIEGEDLSQWVVLDYDFLIIHIFYDYLRDYYRLEDFWVEQSSKKK